MNLEFPRLAYKVGGPWDLECGKFSVREVASAEDLGGEWFLTQEEAKAAHDTAEAEAAKASASDKRAELEARATELGITFRPQWGDKKLAEAIDGAEAAKA